MSLFFKYVNLFKRMFQFIVAQLLSCLHELKMENVRLEETLSQLARRRDHLLALNTRLSLSLASGSSLALGNRYFLLFCRLLFL